MKCKNHNEKQALYQCEKCKTFFCEECILLRKFTDDFTAFICKDCGGRCEPLVTGRKPKEKDPMVKLVSSPPPSASQAPQQPQEKGKPAKLSKPSALRPRFLMRIPGILIFPLKGRGIFVIIISAGLMFLFAEISRRFEAIGLLPWVVFVTYFSVYLFKTADDSSRGSFRLQSLPNLEYWIGMIVPFIYLIFALILCLGPANIYFLFFKKDMDLTYAILWGVGLFFVPMFLTKIVLSRKPSAINPIGVVIAILRTIISYIILCAVLGGIIFGVFYVSIDILSQYGWKGEAGKYVLTAYVCLVMARLLGIFTKYLYERTTGEILV